MKLHIDIEATCGDARAGRVHTARGSFETPIFMPVGTRGAVRAMTSGEMERLGAEIILGNTYHLMLRPGADVVADLGGLHDFMGWPRHTLTDSGGYQVFSLDPKVDDEGVTFKSVYDGSTHRFTPESAVHTQERLGADIQMVLDVCPPLPSPPEVVRRAVERTAAWAARARATLGEISQALEDAEALGAFFDGFDKESDAAEPVEQILEKVFRCRYDRASLIQKYSRDAAKPAAVKETKEVTM